MPRTTWRWPRALRALLEGEGASVLGWLIGGVEFGAIDEVAGVFDGVPLVRGEESPGADFGVDVAEGDGLWRLDMPSASAQTGVFHGRDVEEFDGRVDGDGVERLGAGRARGKRGNFRRERRQLDASGRSGSGGAWRRAPRTWQWVRGGAWLGLRTWPGLEQRLGRVLWRRKGERE